VKVSAHLAVAALLLAVPGPGAGSEFAISARAKALTAGPYGESWTLSVPVEGDATLEVNFMLDRMGRAFGEFLVSEERRKALLQAVHDERFMELPTDVSPQYATVHAPDLRLKITLAGTSHEVKLYDPDKLRDDERALRFLAVWKAAFDIVPWEPEW